MISLDSNLIVNQSGHLFLFHSHMMNSSMDTNNADHDAFDFETFRQNMLLLDQAKQAKDEKLNAIKKSEMVYRKQKYRLQMKRTQMYLGLLSSPSLGIRLRDNGVQNKLKSYDFQR